MATSDLLGPEDMRQCPYDVTHQIRSKRYIYHLLRCSKQHPEKDLVICPYNASHHMPRPTWRHHIATCPDRAPIVRYVIHAQGKRGDTSNPVPSGDQWEVTSEEASIDWDADCTYPHSTLSTTRPTVYEPVTRDPEVIEQVLRRFRKMKI